MKFGAMVASLPLLGFGKTALAGGTLANAKVPLDDPSAVALKYVEVANTATRTEKMGVPGASQICANCRFYAVGEEGAWGGCALFQNRLVAKEGWCVGWVPMA